MIGILLSLGSNRATASDDNPWSMDVPGEDARPDYNLNSKGAAGSFARRQGDVRNNQPLPHMQGAGPKETIIPKSRTLGEGKAWRSGPGKGNRDQIFGYSGLQPQKGPEIGEQMDPARFGAFPPASGEVKEQNEFGASDRKKGSVQFGGRSFGAFPPKESKPVDRERQQWLRFQRERQIRRQQRSKAFANVPPPPVPEPLPERAYAYPYGYGGYGIYSGLGNGIGLDPRIGADGLGRSVYGGDAFGLGGLSTGAGLGALPVAPGLPGFGMPGFMW